MPNGSLSSCPPWVSLAPDPMRTRTIWSASMNSPGSSPTASVMSTTALGVTHSRLPSTNVVRMSRVVVA